MAKFIAEGDKELAGRWRAWAESRLAGLRESMRGIGMLTWSKRFALDPGIMVFISSLFGHETIRIVAEGSGSIIVCHVGDSTSGADYTKRYFDLSGQELPEGLVKATWTLTDDGKYAVNFDLIGSVQYQDDPDDYVYYVDGGGLGVASSVLGIDAKNTAAGRARRFIINEAAEREMWQEMVEYTHLGVTVFQVLTPEAALTTHYYRSAIVQPFVCRYTPTGILTINDTVATSIASVIALNSNEYLNFIDSLMFAAKAYFHPFDPDEAKTSCAIPGSSYDDGTVHPGGALAAAVQHYSDKRMTQTVLRASDFDYDPGVPVVPFDEPLRETVLDLEAETSTDGTEHYRGAGDDREAYCQDGYWISGRTVDGPTQLVTDFGWSTIKNDAFIPAGITEDGLLTGVRIAKDSDMTLAIVSLEVAGEVVEQAEGAPVWIHADDFGAVPQVVGDLGRTPIVALRTHYKILHVHHGAKFDAVVYVKSVYQGNTESWPGYKMAWAGSPLFAELYGRVRENFVTSMNTYHVAVNGVVSDLGYSWTQVERSLTVAPETPDVADVEVTTLNLDTACDAGYDDAGTALASQEQVARIFTSENNSLLLAFDVYPISWRHEVKRYVALNRLGHNVIPASTPAVPPTVDGSYATPSDRRLMFFRPDGTLQKNMAFPLKNKDAGTMWNRLNGISLMEA